MESINTEQKSIDTGMACLIMIAKFHGLNADADQLKHAFAINSDGMNKIDILKASKIIGLKAKAAKIDYTKLRKMVFPAMISTKDEKYLIVAKFDLDKEKILILDPAVGKPELIEKNKLLQIWNDEIILFSKKGFQIKEEIFNIKWFIPTIWKYKKALGEVLLSAFTLQIIGLLTPIVMQVIIDKVLVHQSLGTLDILIIGLVIVTIFETILKIAKTYVFTHTTNKIDVILGARLFSHLFKLPLRYFEVRRVGDTISRVRELENIRQFLTGTPLTIVLDIMFMAVYLVVMFFYSDTLTWILLASLPFFILLSIVITPIFKHRLDEKFRCGAEMNSYLVESVSGVQTVKAMALEPTSQRKWEDISANYTKASFKTSILSGTAGSIGQFIQQISDLLILWIGARLVITGQISVGQLIAFRMLSGRVSGPVLRLVQMWQEFQQVGLSIKRLGDIFNTPTEPSIDPSKAKLPAIKGDIKFEGVRFRYRVDGPEALRNITFEIPAGKTIGIVGRSGSGKSTLSKLVQRLYIPELGKITIDGIDISLVDPAWLRRQIGIVLQESFLFNGTVKENIAIHEPSASMERIINVAKIAGANEFILEMPEGYDTMVGEKGSSLSGGQRQRIAIARALLTNPRILIFDEATSALDYESERVIQQNLSMICKERTVLIIAHRLSTLRDADLIMTLDRGELIEYGTHETLLSTKGMYHYLYSQQSGKPNTGGDINV